jgi:hypothetical protein
MNRFVTRLHAIFASAPLHIPATPSGTPVSTAPTIPLRLANGVMAYRHESVPEPAIDQSSPELKVWCWQCAEGLDKPLAYSR